MKVTNKEAFKNYSKLERARWIGEPIGNYVSEIRRLVGMPEFIGAVMEQMVKVAFAVGFPDHISVRL